MRRAAVAVIIGGYEHRRRPGGQRGRARVTRVTGGSPIRTGRIQFAITGPGS